MFSVPKGLIRRIFLFALLVLQASWLHSQSFRNFPSLTGKKDIAANCMVQCPNGELWVGTAAGLIEYNGESTRLYTQEQGLCDNAVTALYFQNDKTLWIGHKNGKITLYKDKIFTPFPANAQLPEAPVSAFCAASGTWIGTYGDGLFYYGDDHILKKYDTNKGISDNSIYTLCTDGSANVWAGTDAGITYIDMQDMQPKFRVISMKEGLPDNIVRSLVYAPSGNLYVAMQDSGVCNYEIAANSFHSLSSNWKYGTITSMYEDKSNALFIGTEQHGVLKYAAGADGRTILSGIDTKNGLLSNSVNAVFTDREENLWIATAKGLSEQYQSRISFHTFRNGLTSDKIFAFFIDSKNNHWIATDKGLTKYAYTADGQVITAYYFPTGGQPEKQITSIYEDQKGIFWFGSYGNGVYRLDPQTNRQEIISQKEGIANNNVSSVTGDQQGNIWISTLGGGISRISGVEGKRSISNFAEAQGLHADYIYCIFCDSKNNIWIGTDGDGLVRFKDGAFINVSQDKKLEGKTVYSITEDHTGNIWFSLAEQGIYRYDGKTMMRHSLQIGMRDNNPEILVAAGDQVITAHPKGLDVLDRKKNTVRYFSVSDNDIEPNLNAAFTSPAGDIWIGTNSGLIYFRGYNIPADTVTPVVTLNSLVVQYQTYPLDSIKDFSYRQNNFVFSFSAVWLRSADKIKFRYKLEGLDSSYFETESRTASFSSLPPGKYTFLVSAANDEGMWSKPLRYSFVIATPLWQRAWFWIVLVIVTISGFYIFVQWRLQVLQKEKHVLEHKVNVRTAELTRQAKVIEMKNRELERLSIVASETVNIVIIMDAQGRIEWVNESFERLNTITLEELKKQKGESIFDISNNPEIRSIIEKCITEKKPVVYESKNKLKDGRIIWESSTLTPIYNERGELHKLVIIDTDVTERKRDEEIIRQKNKDITDSIEYAKKIQNSILPQISTIKQSLPESFIFFLQKDIVSGDFYWFAHKDDHAVIAAVDCTGHGVPGAFMSLIGYNLLNEIVNEKNTIDPGEILNALNAAVLKALYQNNPENTSRDGMDIALCTINLKTKELRFAGAMRPLYIYGKDGAFREIKGDKISIGTDKHERDFEIKFHTHTLRPAEGDVFYICSDGYADQFGGTNGKKMMTRNFKKILSMIHQQPFAQQQQSVLDHHLQWRGDYEQVDDILVIGFSVV